MSGKQKPSGKHAHHLHIKRPGLSLPAWLLIIFSAIGGLIYVPVSILVVAGMIPTIIAFLADQDERRSMTITIGLMNAAGVSPFLMKLWVEGRTIEICLSLLRHGLTWLVMYGSAMGGVVILFIVPPIVHVFMVQKAKHRIIELEKRQVILRDSWGDEVKDMSSTV